MIKVKILNKSVSPSGDIITSLELEYPRFIHAELMTHRLFSRNAMSSRAVPIDKMIDQVLNSPAGPVEWGKNQAGMQAKELFEGVHIAACEFLWKQAAKRAVESAKELQAKGLHKQIVNRVLEPFQMMKTVVTTTELDNFFWLRLHKDAQPEFRALTQEIYNQWISKEAQLIGFNEWHLPYYEGHYGEGFWKASGYVKLGDNRDCYKYTDHESGYTLNEAQRISASCCAQVSYRVLDANVEKADVIYDRLVNSKPVHASPFEHQATPIIQKISVNVPFKPRTWEDGITHVDRDGNFWSGNLKGFIQYRQLIKDNVCKEYIHVNEN